MSASFAGAQYIALPETQNMGANWTLAVIASHNSIANSACAAMVSINNTSQGSVEYSFSCYFRGDTGGDPVQNRWVENAGARSVVANSAAGYNANELTSIIARGNTSTSGSIFRNGVKTDAVSSGTMTGFGALQLTVGALVIFSNVYQEFLTGDAAMVGYWPVTLTDDECISLAKGFPPRRVRPQSLSHYLPLVRDRMDRRAGSTLTVSGTPPGVSVHPRSYGF